MISAIRTSSRRARISPAPARSAPGYRDHALLLRPDHYVAAAIPLDDADAAGRAVETILSATWPESAQNPLTLQRTAA